MKKPITILKPIGRDEELKALDEILIIGHGRLGSELYKQTDWTLSTHRNHNYINLLNPESIYNAVINMTNLKVIINCAANTDTQEETFNRMWFPNIIGVKNLIDKCNTYNIKLVHISTDYIYANSEKQVTEKDVPATLPSWYCYTKLVSDALVQLESNNYLLIRTSFKERPHTYKFAWDNIICNTDYVDVISEKIIYLINNNANGIYNVGTEEKTMYELAKQTHTNVLPLSQINIPSDTTMCLDKFEKFKNNE